MSELIKLERDEEFMGKAEDDNSLKCGEIVFSNNTRFCFTCVFCPRICERFKEFYLHVLYDHLNYLEEYQFSDDEEEPPSLPHFLQSTKKNTKSIVAMEFLEAELDNESVELDKNNYMKHFERFAAAPFIKTEINDDEEENNSNADCDRSIRSTYSSARQHMSDPKDILHIEILEAPSENNFEPEDTIESRIPESDDEPDADILGSNTDLNLESADEDFNPSSAKDDSKASKDTVYHCPECKKVFSTKNGAKRHVDNVHRGKLEQFTCNTCSKVFRTETQLETHIKRHLGVKPHSCEMCGASFTDKSNLNVHILRHKGIKPHKCSHCEKCFHSTTELKLHTRTHTGERPFICEVCGRKFSNSGHLCSHRRRHLGERRYECDVCQKKFFDRKLLKDHQVMHTDERPFECASCGATFQRRKALMQHAKLHSDVKQYVCKICGKSFAQNAGLYSHMKCH